MKVKSNLLYLSLFSFGASLCSALLLSNYSNIFKSLGVSATQLPWLWLIPPIMGLIIQPLIGQISDDTATRWGKRIPYLIGWGVLCVVAFIFFPFVGHISSALFIVLILNCSLNGNSEALRALTNDLIKEDEMRTKALCLQGFAAGVGAAIGTEFPYLIHRYFLTKEKFHFGTFPVNLTYAFYIAALIFTIVLIVGFIKVKEKIVKQSLLSRKPQKPAVKRFSKIFKDIMQNVRKMSPKFQRLCIMHAVSWLGIFILWLYFSTFMAQNFYHVPYNPGTNLKLYTNAWGKASLDTSYYFSIYQYVSLVFALALMFLPKKVNIKLIHMIALFLGGLGIFFLNFEQTSFWLSVSFIGIGLMWGSMVTIPYVIAMRLLPKGKVGIYLGIFNICITLPQLICGLTLPVVYGVILQRHAGYLMMLSGLFLVYSAYLWFKDSYANSTAWSLKLLREERA